jgi:hypothetical protein
MPRWTCTSSGERFDVVLCFGISHRVTDPIALLRALADVLATGGEIVHETYAPAPSRGRSYVWRGPNWSSVGSAQQNHGSVSRGLPSIEPMAIASSSSTPLRGSPAASRTAARIWEKTAPMGS